MRDRELYATILGISEPWRVERVEVDAKGEAVHVWLERGGESPATCPECGKGSAIYDHRDREWRHLDTCQFQTRLHASVPRVSCAEHGIVQIRVPWAEKGSKFTMLFERLVIDWLQEASVKAVAKRLSLGWEATWGIKNSAAPRTMANYSSGMTTTSSQTFFRLPRGLPERVGLNVLDAQGGRPATGGSDSRRRTFVSSQKFS